MAWADDRDGSAGYDTVTTLATAVDEAVPFCVVYLSDLSADFHTAMSTASDTDGKTIRVSTSDGTTQLACVPIGVNTGTDTGCLIFLGTGMSASVDVDYRIYVGNAALSMPTAGGGMGEQAVFAAYAEAWILNSLTGRVAGTVLTATNSPTAGVSTNYEGVTGYGFTAASTQYLSVSSGLLSTWPITIEAWAEADNTTANHTIAGVSIGSTSTRNRAWMRFSGAASDIIDGFCAGNSSAFSQAGTATYAANTWTYGAVTRSGTTTGTTTVYKDGTASGTESTTLAAASGINRTFIGAIVDDAPDTYLSGTVAVVLLSASARSADYVSTMQDNWAGSLYSAGGWTANDTDVVAGSTGWVLFQTIGQSTSAAADWTNTADALVDDANTAECTLDDGGVFESEYLNFTNPAYGTTIPTGAPSYTVEFRIKRKSDTSSAKEVQDLTVQFIDDTGTRVGDNLADTGADWPSALTTRVPDYVLTGYTPDGTEFTSAAGMALRATGWNTNGATLTEVATAWMRVSWTGTDAAYNTRGFFALTE